MTNDQSTDIIHSHYRPRRAKHRYNPPNWVIYTLAGLTALLESIISVYLLVPWLTPTLEDVWAFSLSTLIAICIAAGIFWLAVTITGDLKQ